MSTHAMVYVKVRDNDLGTKRKCDASKLEFIANSPLGITKEVAKKKAKYVTLKSFIGFYVHWDGYPSDGVGRVLFHKYSDYEGILNLALLGDESQIINGIEPYIGIPNPNVDWTVNKPTSKSTLTKKGVERYEYLFTESGWLYRECGDVVWNILTEEDVEQ